MGPNPDDRRFAFVRIASEIRDAREDRLSNLREQQIVAEERELLSVRNTINDSIPEIRAFVYRPNGAPCDLSTFALTVTEQMERLEQAFGISISVVFSEALAANGTAVVERPFDLTSILVEAVANGVRHGKADRFEVYVEQCRQRGLLIRLLDNAEVSLKTASIAQPLHREDHDIMRRVEMRRIEKCDARPEGLGLASIHTRSRRMGGSVSIRRNGAGDGTVIETAAPLVGNRESTQRS